MTGRLFAAALSALLCGCTHSAVDSAQLAREVNGERAFADVQALVNFGPRPPGSDALERSRGYITRELERAGWTIARQTFTETTPHGAMQFVNLIATFGKDAAPEVIIGSHYDTKIFDAGKFVGANDGGSSTGLLIELGRVFAAHPQVARTIELVFFDGEEAVVSFTDTDGLYGSRHFAKELKASGKGRQFRAALVLDMIGDKSLRVTFPSDSPPEMVSGMFRSAENLGMRDHFSYYSGALLDDHAPLNEIGIPALDVIDFDYASWHTVDDTMDKISAESLRIVGSVVAHYVATRRAE